MEVIKLSTLKIQHRYSYLSFFDKKIKELLIQQTFYAYPEFYNWYKNKVLPAMFSSNNREIILILKDVNILLGFAILKKTATEKKICTLFVYPNYRNNGIGKQLFEESFNYLGTRLPLLTISSTNISTLIPFIKKYNFILTSKISNKYKKRIFEYIYNDFKD